MNVTREPMGDGVSVQRGFGRGIEWVAGLAGGLLGVSAALAQTPPNAPQGQPGAFVSGSGYVWWEAENCTTQTFSALKGHWTPILSEGYSGGRAMNASVSAGATNGATAAWAFSVAAAGDYEFWARIGWRYWNGHEWRLDGGAWNAATDTGGMYEFIKVPTGRGVAEASWIAYGKVPLAAGEHTFEIRLRVPAGKTSAFQYFDCFCLSQAGFIPAGKFRPDEGVPVNPRPGDIAAGDWWPFRPEERAGEKPLLDFSFLNDPIDKHGFVTLKNGDLVFTDGTPVRFWGVNATYWGGQMVYMDKLDADRFADHLSRLGVNCVRIHILHSANSLMDATRDDTQHFDPLKLDRLMYVLAALGKRNIFINLDLMYHRTFLAGDDIDAELVMPKAGAKPDRNYNVSWACGAAAFWHPRAIELNLALYKQLLTFVNPYTGKRLVDTPQMAICNVQNEQSIFWGTTNMRRGRTAQILDELHTVWLKRKYSTQAALAAAWQIEGKPSPLAHDENLDSGIVKLGPVVMTPNGSNDKRVLDQKRFLYDVETGFYKRVIEAMRSWGVKCPIITSNWQGGGNTTRLVLQASTEGDVVDRHNYFNRPESMTAAVGRGTPMEAFERQAGRAFCISEWSHGGDGKFVPESVPLMATVAAIQDWNALFQFEAGLPTWDTDIGGLKSIGAHRVLYPIASMIWRRGDVRTGPLVFERRRDPTYQFGPEPESRVMSTDPAAAAAGEKAATPVPPEIIGIGRIQNAYVETRQPDLFASNLVQKCWDKDKGIVVSAAGDVEWRYSEQWVKIDSPRTQGAFGALAGRKIECADVGVVSSNEEAAVLISSLDGQPIAQAERLVVAVVGRAAPNGMTAAAGGRPPAWPPCLMEPVKGTVSVKTGLRTVTAVSATGYRIVAVPAKRDGDRLSFDMGGQPQVFYYVVSR